MYLLLLTGCSNTSSHKKRMEMTHVTVVQKSLEHTRLKKGSNLKTWGQILRFLLWAGQSGTSFEGGLLDLVHEDGEQMRNGPYHITLRPVLECQSTVLTFGGVKYLHIFQMLNKWLWCGF